MVLGSFLNHWTLKQQRPNPSVLNHKLTNVHSTTSTCEHVLFTFRHKVCTLQRLSLDVCSRVNEWGFLKERPNVRVFTSVLGALVSKYTLTLLLSQVDGQDFTSRIASLSTNCCALQPCSHEKQCINKDFNISMSCIYRKMSTSHLYAHLFVNMCGIYWMLHALYEDFFKSSVKTSCIRFSGRTGVNFLTGLQPPPSVHL